VAAGRHLPRPADALGGHAREEPRRTDGAREPRDVLVRPRTSGATRRSPPCATPRVSARAIRRRTTTSGTSSPRAG
jgi:hypothetical protein